jgi:hypothetical protein
MVVKGWGRGDGRKIGLAVGWGMCGGWRGRGGGEGVG